MSLQFQFYLYILYWSKDDHLVFETCSHVTHQIKYNKTVMLMVIDN